MKKAFTLTETLITMVILGVIAAIVLPMFMENKPEKERVMYKKSIYVLQDALNSAWEDFSNTPASANTGIDAIGDTYWSGVTDSTFCTSIANHLNLASDVNCLDTKDLTEIVDTINPAVPDFITANGVKWWGFSGGAVKTTDVQTVYLDVNGDAKPNEFGKDILKLNITYDGKVTIPAADATDAVTGTDWSVENGYLRDTTKVTKD